jgi:hypothetical protein
LGATVPRPYSQRAQERLGRKRSRSAGHTSIRWGGRSLTAEGRHADALAPGEQEFRACGELGAATKPSRPGSSEQSSLPSPWRAPQSSRSYSRLSGPYHSDSVRRCCRRRRQGSGRGWPASAVIVRTSRLTSMRPPGCYASSELLSGWPLGSSNTWSGSPRTETRSRLSRSLPRPRQSSNASALSPSASTTGSTQPLHRC